MPFLAWVVVAAAPIVIAPLGFSVQVDGPTVAVVSVVPGSPAGKAGLPVGCIIARVYQPQFLFAMKPLAELPAADLEAALTPAHGEQLVFECKPRGPGALPVTLQRTDPAPADPFPELPLPAEKLARLSLGQQGQYFLALQKAQAQKAEDARAIRPPLTLEGDAQVDVGPDRVHWGIRAGATPESIYFDGRLGYACRGGPMRSIEVGGKVVATSTDAHLQGASVEVQLPMWRTKDALDACRKKQATLPSVALTGTLRCEGKEPLTVPLSRTLTLRCVDKASDEHLDVLRIVSRDTVVVGSREPVRVSIGWRFLRPTPVSAALVELDQKGAVVRRYAAMPAPANDEIQIDVPVDLRESRAVRLALEVKFPDGTVDRSSGSQLWILTQATYDAEQKLLQQGY